MSSNRIILNMEDSEVKTLNRALNLSLKKKYDWFHEIKIIFLTHYKSGESVPKLSGIISVDEDWFAKQWREYHYSAPIPDPNSEDISIGDIVGGYFALELAVNIKTILQLILSTQIQGFQWFDLFVRTKENSITESNIKDNIKRILREETEEYKVNLVKKIIYTLYDNISFIEESTYDGRPLLIIYFESDDTAANIESWFDEKISRDIREWTSGNIVVCPDWIFNWDERKKNADVFINTELLKYDNLGNVVNESVLKEEMRPHKAMRRTHLIDYEITRLLDKVYKGKKICELYDDEDMFVRVVTEAVVENLYFNTFYMMDDTSLEWEKSVDFIYDYVKDSYGKSLTDYYNRVCRTTIETNESVIIEQLEEFGDRSKLESLVIKFVKTFLKYRELPENYYDVIVDIYEVEVYGTACKITFLFKKPFSSEDSDFVHEIGREIKKLIEDFFPYKFRYGVNISTSTIEHYLKTKGYYDDMKVKKSEQTEGELTEKCWPGYTQKGMKTMFGKRYPNCVKKPKKKVHEHKETALMEANDRTKKLIKKYVDEMGLMKSSKMIGISQSKIIELIDIPIDSEIAYAILTEKMTEGELKNIYKQFIITLDRMDGIFYWETNTRTDHYPEDRIQQFTVMATPFWDGSKFTPVEISWFTLYDDDMNVIHEVEGGGSFYKEFKHQKNFDSVQEVLNWYEEIYLPGVHDIIMNTLLPKVYKVVDFEMR